MPLAILVPSRPSTQSAISRAALLVNVMARMAGNETPRSRIR